MHSETIKPKLTTVVLRLGITKFSLFFTQKLYNSFIFKTVISKTLNIAGAEGFEPPTLGFGDRCSSR